MKQRGRSVLALYIDELFLMPPQSQCHCFCNLCKGNTLLSSFRVKQHLKIYGLWEANKSHDDPAAAKKSRVDNEGDHSSDSEPEGPEAYYADDATCIKEDHGDYDSDGNHQAHLVSGSTSAKVHLQ